MMTTPRLRNIAFSVDSPEVFGLHPNADLAFSNKEVRNLLATILETQPKGGGSSGGPTREDVVYAKCEEILSGIPGRLHDAGSILRRPWI